MAGFVLANGSLSSNQSGEGEIRKNIVEAGAVDCIVAMSGQLFYSTPIPACLWFIARDRKNGRFRDRRKEMLFIDARKMGTMVDRTHRELTDEDIAKIASTYHAWRGDSGSGKYEDVKGFCKSAAIETVAGQGFVLTPGRYVGYEDVCEDHEQFDEKISGLISQLEHQFRESESLQRQVGQYLREMRQNARQQ
jgi:type I restriction enzyme M protein